MPTEISTIEQLQAMNADLFGDYILTRDIDASPTLVWNGGAGFAPIGSIDNEFRGRLNGQGFTVSNLYINRPVTRVGLLGAAIGSAAFDYVVAQDLQVEATINADSRVGVLVGSLGRAGAGLNLGRLVRCSGLGAVTAEASADGRADMGGLCGFVDQRGLPLGLGIEDCISRVRVQNPNAGERVGGLIGNYYSKSYRCLSTGPVESIGQSTGGFQGTGSAPPATVAESCFWDIDGSGQSESFNNVGAAAHGLTTAEARALSTYTAAGWDIVAGLSDSHVWGIDPTINDGYPFLQVFHTGPGRNRKRRRLLAAHHHFAIRRR